MEITNKEIKKVVSVIFLSTGYFLLDKYILDFITNTLNISPLILGIIIIIIGAYLFKIT